MTDPVLLLIIVIAAITGGYLPGFFIGRLKVKAKAGELREQNNQQALYISELKSHHINTLEDKKSELHEVKLQYDRQLEKTENERDTIRKERDFLNIELSKRNAEFENLQQKNLEQKGEVEQLQKKFETQFENLANKILEEKSEKFTSINRQNIENILNPLNEKIKNFEEKVNKNNIDFIDRHAQLGEYLKNLNEQSVKISQEANNLTRALKGDNKIQGNWGELILEKVLEKSGLEKDREYFIQKALTTEEGKKMLPDVILHLPNGRKMIIDSKVSLTSYERYINAEEEEAGKKHLKDHIKSLHNHITLLSNKKYEDLYKTESLDFVIMFIPIEPALYLAQNLDNSFFYTAFQKNILLVSPTTLLSTLRTIDNLWSNEKQQRNAIEIANHAASLYHKFKILLDDLEAVGNKIKSTSNAYETAIKKLTGKQNLIKDIDRLEKLGIAPKKRIAAGWLPEPTGNDNEDPTENKIHTSKEQI